MELKHTLLKNQRGNQKISEANENENTSYRNLWDTAKAVLRGKFIVINAHTKKKRNILNKQLNFIPQGTRKRTTKAKVSRRKEINEID